MSGLVTGEGDIAECEVEKPVCTAVLVAARPVPDSEKRAQNKRYIRSVAGYIF